MHINNQPLSILTYTEVCIIQQSLKGMENGPAWGHCGLFVKRMQASEHSTGDFVRLFGQVHVALSSLQSLRRRERVLLQNLSTEAKTHYRGWTKQWSHAACHTRFWYKGLLLHQNGTWTSDVKLQDALAFLHYSKSLAQFIHIGDKFSA